MIAPQFAKSARRNFLAGAAATGLLALPGCESIQRHSLIVAIRRLLSLAARNALARLMAPGGFWDNELARIDLPNVFGSRGNVLLGILTSVTVKNRLQRSLNRVAERGARRAAPVIADVVRTIGIDNAQALLRGGPTAATGFLRQSMGASLIDTMVPELAEGIRIAEDPVVGQAIAALTGIDLTGVARSLSGRVDESIWGEIGREEAAIRANPESTNDPELIWALKAL
ncbi:MAG: DUF4197 domain-containing protein [Novosphingobium sp.]